VSKDRETEPHGSAPRRRLPEGHLEHLCRLCRLHLSPVEQGRLRADLMRILDFMQIIREREGPAPIPADPSTAVPVAGLRADQTEAGWGREAALRNAPHHSAGFFVAPPTLPGSEDPS